MDIERNVKMKDKMTMSKQYFSNKRFLLIVFFVIEIVTDKCFISIHMHQYCV